MPNPPRYNNSLQNWVRGKEGCWSCKTDRLKVAVPSTGQYVLRGWESENIGVLNVWELWAYHCCCKSLLNLTEVLARPNLISDSWQLTKKQGTPPAHGACLLITWSHIRVCLERQFQIPSVTIHLQKWCIRTIFRFSGSYFFYLG
jgi:hypothetical protein